MGKIYRLLPYAHLSLKGGVRLRFSCLYSPHVSSKSPWIFLAEEKRKRDLPGFVLPSLWKRALSIINIFCTSETFRRQDM